MGVINYSILQTIVSPDATALMAAPKTSPVQEKSELKKITSWYALSSADKEVIMPNR